MASPHQFRLDLLAYRPLRALVSSLAFPIALQAMALAGVLLFIWNAWGVGQGHSGAEIMTLRKTNLTTLSVWGLWWPGMIALALALGRAWCTVCPMELANRAGDALARRVGWPRARFGRWLRAGWLVVVAYLVLQVLVAGVSIHRVPHFTAVMLIALLAGALAAGLAFREPRAFCKGLCPAGGLLSVYGRYTPAQLDVRDPEVCAGCKTRDCVAQENRNRFDKRSCPSLLRPYARAQSDGCVLCFQCAKVCPYGNIAFGLARPTAGVRRHRLLEPSEAAFVLFAAGFVAHEVIGEVKWLDEFFHAVPTALQRLAPAVGFGWFEALWFLVLFPLVLWSVAAVVARASSGRQSVRTLLLAAATGAAPAVAVAHLAKSAAKVASWGGFLPLAVADPAGVETLRQLSAKTLAQPARWVGLPLLGWAMLILLVLVAWRSVRWIREASGESARAAYSGFAVTTAFFAAALLVWPWA
ncbi:MAG: hypothetical protein FJ291_30460 [Planctomycetes bacterium]|nr:hypothetical protein [Planctomycetota bacterium]